MLPKKAYALTLEKPACKSCLCHIAGLTYGSFSRPSSLNHRPNSDPWLIGSWVVSSTKLDCLVVTKTFPSPIENQINMSLSVKIVSFVSEVTHAHQDVVGMSSSSMSASPMKKRTISSKMRYREIATASTSASAPQRLRGSFE